MVLPAPPGPPHRIVPMSQRLFAAIYPPPAACEDLARVLATQPPGLRWAPPDRWHLTLAFCAAVEDRSRDALVAGLDAVTAEHRPLRLRIAGAGAFPRATRAAVLWAGIEPAADQERERLSELAADVRAACERAGAAPDRRRFAPHLTLARLRHPRDVSPRVWALDPYRGPQWSAAEIVLVGSRLGAAPGGGALHEPVATFPLGID